MKKPVHRGGKFAVGIAIGVALGVALNNIPLGVALGVVLGIVMYKAQKDPAEDHQDEDGKND